MSTSQQLSPEVEALERAIDVEYLQNPLAGLTFSEAAWFYLAFCEEQSFKGLEIDGVDTRQDMACFVDGLVNSMKTPLSWLFRTCKPGNQIPKRYSADTYQASWDFSKLGHEYDVFQTPFIYARAGVAKLDLQGDTLVATTPFRDDARFEAYDRLEIPAGPRIQSKVSELLAAVAQTVTILGEEFRYKLNPSIVSRGLDALMPVLTQNHWLPAEWKMPRYTFGNFQAVVSAIQVMAFIHHLARITAARRGCVGMGYANSVLVMKKRELLNRLRRYTALDESVVSAIILDLTYGERGIRNPDPALQPLIPLTQAHIALPPALLIGISAERNFTILLNRLPEERDVYSVLSTRREEISRANIKERLEKLPLRFWSGEIPGRRDLPDLDLAIIDDKERSCLILELKAFIGAAEPREVMEKSLEIARGVAQVLKLQHAFRNEPATITVPLNVDTEYHITFAVASETSVGTNEVQDESVPVVRTPHLVRRILADLSLCSVCKWLEARGGVPSCQESRGEFVIIRLKPILSSVLGLW